jgi:hypothetical protein
MKKGKRVHIRIAPIQGEELRCKCGGTIIIEEARSQTHHSAPACKWWLELTEKHGARPIGETHAPEKKSS